MKAKISLLAIIASSAVNYSYAETAESVEVLSSLTVETKTSDQQGWNNFGSLNFDITSAGMGAQKYTISKAWVGQVMSVSDSDTEYHFVETQQGALFQGVGHVGIHNYDECNELIGDAGIALNVSPTIVRFFLSQAAPSGPSSVSSKQPFDINDTQNNAEITIGDETYVDIEGESYFIGPKIELMAPWGAAGEVSRLEDVAFDFTYYSTVDGQKDRVEVQGEWSSSMGPMDKFNQEPVNNWLVCVTPEVKATLAAQTPKLVGETLEIMTEAELANGAI